MAGSSEGGAETSRGEAIDLSRLGRLLWRRRRWIVIPTLACAAAALVAVTTISPRYTGVAKVLLENQESYFTRPDKAVGTEPSADLDPEGVQSQAETVATTELARKAIDRLQLAQRVEFNPPEPTNPAGDRLVAADRRPRRQAGRPAGRRVPVAAHRLSGRQVARAADRVLEQRSGARGARRQHGRRALSRRAGAGQARRGESGERLAFGQDRRAARQGRRGGQQGRGVSRQFRPARRRQRHDRSEPAARRHDDPARDRALQSGERRRQGAIAAHDAARRPARRDPAGDEGRFAAPLRRTARRAQGADRAGVAHPAARTSADEGAQPASSPGSTPKSGSRPTRRWRRWRATPSSPPPTSTASSASLARQSKTVASGNADDVHLRALQLDAKTAGDQLEVLPAEVSRSRRARGRKRRARRRAHHRQRERPARADFPQESPHRPARDPGGVLRLAWGRRRPCAADRRRGHGGAGARTRTRRRGSARTCRACRDGFVRRDASSPRRRVEPPPVVAAIAAVGRAAAHARGAARASARR